MPKALQPHPDRALPAGEARDVARRIHASTKDLPLLCLHGHVDIGAVRDRRAVRRPGRAAGRAGPLRHPDADLPGHLPRPPRTPPPRRQDDRRPARDLAGVLRELAPLPRDAEPVLAGARVRRGPRRRPRIRRPRPPTSCTTRSPRGSPSRSSGPRALLDRFGIELIATTDAATDDLAQHAKVAADLPGRVIPTFRPDAVVHLDRPGWPELAEQLGALAERRHLDVRRVPAGDAAAAAGVRRGGCAGDRPRSPECGRRTAVRRRGGADLCECA